MSGKIIYDKNRMKSRRIGISKRILVFGVSFLVAVTGMGIPVVAQETDEAAKGTQQFAPVSEEEQVTGAAEPSFVMETAEADDAEILPAIETTETANAAAVLPDSEELLLDYMEQEVSVSSEAKDSQYGKTHLTGLNLKVYQILRSYSEQVADGTRHSTEFTISLRNDLQLDPALFRSYSAEDLGVEAIVTEEDGKKQITDEALKAVLEKLGGHNLKKILVALLFDCPADLYWYDKTVKTSVIYHGIWFKNNCLLVDQTAEFTYKMPVAAEYAADGETYLTSEEPIGTVQDAIANARKIVEENAALGDYEKLLAYKNAICEAVSYNKKAAGGGSVYGNPWQIIWVFDGDSKTNVVCEGYSKAFQFLCDSSEFLSGNVESHIVSGETTGPHMWNLVTLDDGKNYVADITNSDTGTIGANGGLFLAGLADGAEMTDVEDPFSIPYRTGYAYTYQYDEETLLYYTAEELRVTNGNYIPVSHTPGEPVIKDRVEADCVTDGSYVQEVYCTDSDCDRIISRVHVRIPASGHRFINYVSDHNATCFLNGTKTAKCEWCDATNTLSDYGTKKDHSPVHVAAKASTTTVQGNVEYWECSACHWCFLDAGATKPVDRTAVKLPLVKKQANPIKVKAKKAIAVKASKLKRKPLRIGWKKVMTVSKAKGAVMFEKVKGNKKILVAANGTITLSKGLKAGTYKVVIRVKAAGTSRYAAGSKKLTLKIRIR